MVFVLDSVRLPCGAGRLPTFPSLQPRRVDSLWLSAASEGLRDWRRSSRAQCHRHRALFGMQGPKSRQKNQETSMADRQV